MAAPSEHPDVDVHALFEQNRAERAHVDRVILQAAGASGFLSITGLPPSVRVPRTAAAELLRIFALPEAALRPLWRRKFEPANPNVYRGWFPVQPGNLTHKEGIDLGADVLYGSAVVDPHDPLREPTPLPAEVLLPGWRAVAAAYYLCMERVSAALMQSLARSLSLREHFFDAAFQRGLSTLRLLRYPLRTEQELAASDPRIWIVHEGRRCLLAGAPHTDSGFITLLWQEGVQGLQARTRAGGWIDIPPRQDALTVNFGQVLERWTGGRIKATEHRVVGAGSERYSIAYFHEARAAAEIRPLPMDAPDSFDPFLYGDYLWERIVQFVEFRGMESLRKPQRVQLERTPAS